MVKKENIIDTAYVPTYNKSKPTKNKRIKRTTC